MRRCRTEAEDCSCCWKRGKAPPEYHTYRCLYWRHICKIEGVADACAIIAAVPGVAAACTAAVVPGIAAARVADVAAAAVVAAGKGGLQSERSSPWHASAWCRVWLLCIALLHNSARVVGRLSHLGLRLRETFRLNTSGEDIIQFGKAGAATSLSQSF